ncbi:pilus assembly protein [Rugamonas sp. DEMB1]|uniref:pilus assembly protein n=1 Tax=Rugamonas sp. DEMB1 TaxID=3039386 RepID=UPI0024481B28|nr:PilC/PilY family type IV pilus protein [Rugamonas sp. DEMB1]WGG48993.1 PilC/PilY family type IV pilus protein [Rugamonas sp. DEMB1]
MVAYISLAALLWLALAPPRGLAAPPPLAIAAEPLTVGCALAGPAAPARLHGAAVAPPSVGGDIFQADFQPADWSGHVLRYGLTLDAGGAVAGPPKWDAGEILTGAPGQPARPEPARRNIHSAVARADGTLDSVPFEWAELSPGQRAALNLAPSQNQGTSQSQTTLAGAALGAAPAVAAGSAAARRSDGLGEQRLAFLRGDRALEGGPFRRRDSVLGDSLHATPVYVGAASAGGRGAGYEAFYRRSLARRGVLYLGANDGMLHAFDAADGVELYAYVPQAVFAALGQLSSPRYAHRAYVDGPAGAGEALLDGQWKSVLVSGLGGGGQGVFALDVSDPERLGPDTLLWEFGDADDPAMGNVVGVPQIARLRVRTVSGVAELRHFAVVASGLNNYVDDGHRTAAGEGALFLLALDKPRGTPWRRNVNYYRLGTPVADPTLANALGPPALAADADGALRYAYAGDLQGNLWRFDFSAGAPWSGAVGPGAGRAPLFVARAAGGERQPISQQPRLAFANGGGYLVLFGTGRLIEQADRLPARYAQQSWYGIIDSLAQPAELVAGRRDLSERVAVAISTGGGGNGAGGGYAFAGAPLAPGSKGWYIDFPRSAETGERSLASAVLAGGQLFFDTLLPARDPCAAALSRSYALDVLDGVAAATGRPQPDYAPTAPLLRQTAVANGARAASGQIAQRKTVAIVRFRAEQAAPLAQAGSVGLAMPAGRLSWREVANWRELHEAVRP